MHQMATARRRRLMTEYSGRTGRPFDLGRSIVTGQPAPPHSPYRSFWQAGFEGADHINGSGFPLCMVDQTGHVDHADEDYRAVRQLGMATVRESVGWRSLDSDAQPLILDRVLRREDAARRHGVQVLWTVVHYGVPAGVDLFSSSLAGRLADACAAVARALRPLYDDAAPPIYTPINEISFLSWAACETGLIHPHVGNRSGDGYAMKMNLVAAAIAAIDAMRNEDPRARFLSVDPLIHMVPDNEQMRDAAREHSDYQFQASDMLCGRREPQLGGSPAHLDLVGVNYYPNNQWVLETGMPLGWPCDPRRRRLSLLLQDVADRYQKPLTISETSHVGNQRGPWIHHIASEVSRARVLGVAVEGVCLYPALDRPDWEQPQRWHASGMWHVCAESLRRRLEHEYADALRDARQLTRLGDDSRPFPQSPVHTHGNSMTPLIVFSHLRWHSVYQRPQHLLTRIASRRPVLFVEEPRQGDLHMAVSAVEPGVTVLVPVTPLAAVGFDGAQFEAIGNLLLDYLSSACIDTYDVWFYTPMAFPLLDQLAPGVVVYDCMDELSAFRFAPEAMLTREQRLLDVADVVFTGGPSLYVAKRNRHPNVHCMPSSVDAAHFAQALVVAPSLLLTDIPHPRLGFYGVIDERLDLELLEAIADSNHDWQLVMVGPVVKIDPAQLPRRANLHYLPQQDYACLPSLLAGWDACLLPFALNEATRHISPTKTLEYLCAEKPIVSTAIADVSRLYGPGVVIAQTRHAFIAACAAALSETDSERHKRRAIQRDLIASTSWDRTAAEMEVQLQRARLRVVSGRPARPAGEAVDRVDIDDTTTNAAAAASHAVLVPLPKRRRPNDARIDCLIVGAGPTGLAAALHLGADSLTIDTNDHPGGWCRSIKDGGYTFDYAGHIMFSKDPYVLALYDTLLGDNLHWQDREAWVYSKGVHTRYPFQGALHGLPVDVLKECIVGAIEARYGGLKTAARPAPAAVADASDKTDAACATAASMRADCCADGVVLESLGGDVKDAIVVPLAGSAGASSATVAALSSHRGPRNFEEFIDQVWGAGVAKHFAVPYNTKLWTVPLCEMETSWLGGRVPLPDLEEMIEGALRPVMKPVGPNARFGYPLHGGFQALMDGFLPHLKGELRLSTRLVDVDLAKRVATLDDGGRIEYDTLLSTMPLPELIKMLGEQVPEHVRRAANGLRHVSVRCVNLGIARVGITDKHWIYYPENTVFHRIFVQGNASPHNNPVNGFGLTCEITYSPTKPLPCDDDALIARCIAECRQVGLLRDDDTVDVANVIDMPYAYVVYDHARADNVTRIRTWLAAQDIQLAGRYSEWEYYNSDHAFVAGKRAAESILQRSATGTLGA